MWPEMTSVTPTTTSATSSSTSSSSHLLITDSLDLTHSSGSNCYSFSGSSCLPGTSTTTSSSSLVLAPLVDSLALNNHDPFGIFSESTQDEYQGHVLLQAAHPVFEYDPMLSSQSVMLSGDEHDVFSSTRITDSYRAILPHSPASTSSATSLGYIASEKQKQQQISIKSENTDEDEEDDDESEENVGKGKSKSGVGGEPKRKRQRLSHLTVEEKQLRR